MLLLPKQVHLQKDVGAMGLSVLRVLRGCRQSILLARDVERRARSVKSNSSQEVRVFIVVQGASRCSRSSQVVVGADVMRCDGMRSRRRSAMGREPRRADQASTSTSARTHQQARPGPSTNLLALSFSL